MSETEKPNEKRKAKSWTALAKMLNVSRQTLWVLRDKNGGPDKIDFEAWQAFLEKRANEQPSKDNAQFQGDEMSGLRMKLLRAQAGKEEAIRKLRELELKREESGLVPMSEAQAAIKKVLGPMRSLLDAFPKAIALQANPADPVQAEDAARAGLDKIFEMMTKEMNDQA
tara:strand:+ start:69 stop:575 length:507 start_codon:yes stop_codon:yes gene_type:complete